MRYLSIVVFLFWLIGNQCAWSSVTQQEMLTYVGESHGIREYKLNNQLQILLKPDTSSTELAVNMIYHHGRKNEQLGLTELNHVLEHYLVHRSEETHKNNHPDLKFRGTGITASDFTYYRSVLKNATDLAPFIEMERERMSQFKDHLPYLRQSVDEVDEELTAAHQNKTYTEYGLMLKNLFRNEAYGVNPVGEKQDLRLITLQDLRQYWSEHYRPDRATLLIAGNFDLPSTLALITEKFSSVPLPQQESKKFKYQKLPQYGEREFIIRKHDAKPVVWVGYRVPQLNSSEYAAVLMAGTFISPTTDTSIWQKSLLDAKKAESVDAYTFPFVHGSAFMLRIRLSTEQQLAELRKFLTQQEKNLALQVTDKMINAQKAELLDDLNKKDKSPKQFVESIAPHVVSGDWQSYYRLRDEIENMNAVTYRQSLQRWFRPENRTLGIFLDPRDSLPLRMPKSKTVLPDETRK
ncbi:M16 family metallopeptidase [Undibacterium squillarum]|uniref:M16 family metallopeptidase n=1 Tax=Undibacterium squillarum TaxID=1131567 RepID=UPI0035ADA46B